MNPGPVLIVEDDDDLRRLLASHLRREGFATAEAASGSDAWSVLERDPRPSLVLLDLMLPDLRGTELCRRIRASPALADLPVVMLSAQAEEIDRVVGFEVGADDYVVKGDLSLRELVLRIRAVLRRGRPSAAPRPRDPIESGLLRLDAEGHRAWVADEEIALTRTELRVLSALMEQPGRVLTRTRLLHVVWDDASGLDVRTVDTHVKRLREKLGAGAAAIVTVRGVGYRYEPA